MDEPFRFLTIRGRRRGSASKDEHLLDGRPSPQTDSSATRPRGRPRSRSAHRAVLEAALALVEREGYGAVTMERLAAQAGVGKQTLYRWWPSKAAVVLEAYLREVERRQPPALPAQGAGADLRLAVKRTVAAARSARTVLPGLIADAQRDSAFALVFRTGFIAPRRRKLARLIQRAQPRPAPEQSISPELVADMIHGAIWYRLLAGHAPLDQRFADALATAALGALHARS